jgi:hypothetical protein
MTKSKAAATRFRDVLTLLEKNHAYLSALGLDEATLNDYRRLIGYLKRRSPVEVDDLLRAAAVDARASKVPAEDISDAIIAEWSHDEVQENLCSPKLTRAFLERLASVRFGMTRGALSSLRSIDALRDKILTLLAHEGTHAAISRVASAEGQSKRADKT